MSVTLANSYHGDDTTGTGFANFSVTLTSAQTFGNLIVVQFGYSWSASDPGILSVTDTIGNTYQQVGSIVKSGNLGRVVTYKARWIASAGASANAVKITWAASTATFPSVFIAEASGATDVDLYKDGTGNSTAPATSSGTTNYPGELGLAFAYADNDNSASGINWSGITGMTPDTNGAWAEQQSLPTKGTSISGTTACNTGPWAIAMVTLQPTFTTDPALIPPVVITN